MLECFSFSCLDNFEVLSVVMFEFYCLYFLGKRFDFGAVCGGWYLIHWFLPHFSYFFGCWDYGFPAKNLVFPTDGAHLRQVASGSFLQNLVPFLRWALVHLLLYGGKIGS